MIINFNTFGGGGASDPKKLDVEVFNQFTQDQATVDESQNEAIEGIEGDIARIDSKIDDIELFKFPNATIIGEPTIQNGQISGFSTMNYLQFPFILDLHNQRFQIDFCFTTATNVQTQQNILDSKFGIALAISGGKGLMAISSDGTSWNIGSVSGTMNIESNTTYYARLSWDGIQYKTFLSTDGTNYTQDMVLVGAQAPHPTTIFIGGCDTLETGHTPHPFLGTVNMNKATLTVMGNVIWQGMDDAGLATRLATNLNNIDEVGKERIKEIVGTIPTKTSELTNDSGFLTEHQSLEGYAKTADVEANYQPKGDYATEQWVEEQGYLTEHQPLKTINGETIVGDGDITFSTGGKTYVVKINEIRTNCTFSIFNHTDNKWPTDVTFSGEAVQYSTVGGSMNKDVYFNGYNGTMTWLGNNYVTATILIRINGVWGISFTITRPNALQEKLTSGTNIKTINGNSILGSGDINLGNIEMTATLEDGSTVTYNLYGKQA